MRYALLSLLLASAFAQTVPPATPADKPKFKPTAKQGKDKGAWQSRHQ